MAAAVRAMEVMRQFAPAFPDSNWWHPGVAIGQNSRVQGCRAGAQLSTPMLVENSLRRRSASGAVMRVKVLLQITGDDGIAGPAEEDPLFERWYPGLANDNPAADCQTAAA